MNRIRVAIALGLIIKRIDYQAIYDQQQYNRIRSMIERRKHHLSPLGPQNGQKKKRIAHSQDEIDPSLFHGENRVKLTPLDPYSMTMKDKQFRVFQQKQTQYSGKQLCQNKNKEYGLKQVKTNAHLPKIIPTRTVTTPSHKQNSKDINLHSAPLNLIDFGIFSERDRLDVFTRKFQTNLRKKFEGGLNIEGEEDWKQVQSCLMASILWQRGVHNQEEL